MDDVQTINELDLVALRHDIPEQGLRRGDVGTVVHCYADGRAYEVEMMTGDGRTVAVLTLSPPDVRLLGSRDILHAREVVLP